MEIRAARASESKELAKLMVQAMEDLALSFVRRNDLEEAYSAFEHLCREESNLYSYQNSRVLIDERGLAGAISGYDGSKLLTLRKPVFDYFSTSYGFDTQMEEETQAGELYIDTLSVFPDRQGRGYGKLLIQDFIRHAADTGFDRVGLLVDLKNPQAKKLYERLGFVKVGEKTLLGGQYEHLQFVVK